MEKVLNIPQTLKEALLMFNIFYFIDQYEKKCTKKGNL